MKTFILDCINPKEFSMSLNIGEGTIEYSADCDKLLRDIRYIVVSGFSRTAEPHVKDKYRGVSICTYYDKTWFLGMLEKVIGLEFCGHTRDDSMYNVPEELTLEVFNEAISYRGVVKYLRSLGVANLPHELKADKELLGYFNSCSVCCGNGFNDRRSVIYWSIDKGSKTLVGGRDLGNNNKIVYSRMHGINFCPKCGMEL